MSPQFLAQQLHAGRLEANAERMNRGFPPLGPPGQPQPPAAPAAVPVVVPPQPPALPGVLAPAVAVVPPVAPGQDYWVATEDAGGRSRGDVVCVDPAPLPAGHVILGNKALIPSLVPGNEGCLVVNVPQSEAPQDTS